MRAFFSGRPLKTAPLIFLLCVSVCFGQTADGAWFVFSPEHSREEGGRIDLSDWLDKPAGKHGFLQMQGKNFVFADGTPVKFWGVNICSDKPFVAAEEAGKWTRFMARHGINAVRFHKFTRGATDGLHSTRIKDERWQRFDFFCRELREAGIYYGWSHIYGLKVLPADSSRILAYEELKDTRFPWSHLNGTTASLVNFAEDLQDLSIELTVHMLNHRNPHTGLRYAEDPALSFVELQNEDNIFWGAMEETLKQTPTYRALLCRKFSRWLRQKYGSEEALLQAWGPEGLQAGESLELENIYPRPSHGFFSQQSNLAQEAGRPIPAWVVDRATFLYEEQLSFYRRYIQAIRETGYQGVIIGSCWQAGSGLTHFYNLHSDYLAGAIDRHNYFGGGEGRHRMSTGKVNAGSMLSLPGSGLLSTGFQQVADRPFQFSEWMSLIPNEWTAESAPIVAIYGMGLQGWDASYAFAMDYSHYTPTIQSGHGVYNITSPTQLALYPALAALVYRGDVQEGRTAVNRNVNLSDLRSGKNIPREKVSQEFDIKRFSAEIPLAALAVGPLTLSFDQPDREIKPNLRSFLDEEGKIVRSNTRELEWDYSGRGYFSVNTPGTKAVVGFSGSKEFRLGEVSIRTHNPFSVVFVSSLDKDRPISQAGRLLITTIARARNTGMIYSGNRAELVATGEAPIELEAVKVELKIRRKGRAVVYPLDHDGRRKDTTISVGKDWIQLDGGRFQSFYYEVVYDE